MVDMLRFAVVWILAKWQNIAVWSGSSVTNSLPVWDWSGMLLIGAFELIRKRFLFADYQYFA